MFKVMIIGSYGVGKSTLVNYLSYNKICEHIKPTVGFRCVPYKDITFFDISGNKSFSDILYDILMNECHMIVVCVDLQDPKSIEFAKYWTSYAQEKENHCFITVLKYCQESDPLYKLHDWTSGIPVVKCNVHNKTGLENFENTLYDFKKKIDIQWVEVSLHEESFKDSDDEGYATSCVPFWRTHKETKQTPPPQQSHINPRSSWYHRIYDKLRLLWSKLF